MTVVDRPARRRSRGPAPAAASAPAAGAAPALPEGWRDFVGRWLQSEGCRVRPAARGEVVGTTSENRGSL